MPPNVDEGVCYTQPRKLAERIAIARDFAERFAWRIPLLVDGMDDAAMRAYSAWPERLYVIDAERRVTYKGGLGPFAYRPEEVERWLRAFTSSQR